MKFLYAVSDPQRQAVVKEVLVDFKKSVLDHYNEFARGVIHGDCNEHNIVVAKESPTSDEFRVSGIIDFGDSCKTLYVFELAITIAYMLLQSCELETAGYVIAGYQQIRLIPPHERSVLKVICIYIYILCASFHFPFIVVCAIHIHFVERISSEHYFLFALLLCSVPFSLTCDFGWAGQIKKNTNQQR